LNIAQNSHRTYLGGKQKTNHCQLFRRSSARI